MSELHVLVSTTADLSRLISVVLSDDFYVVIGEPMLSIAVATLLEFFIERLSKWESAVHVSWDIAVFALGLAGVSGTQLRSANLEHAVMTQSRAFYLAILMLAAIGLMRRRYVGNESKAPGPAAGMFALALAIVAMILPAHVAILALP